MYLVKHTRFIMYTFFFNERSVICGAVVQFSVFTSLVYLNSQVGKQFNVIVIEDSSSFSEKAQAKSQFELRVKVLIETYKCLYVSLVITVQNAVHTKMKFI